MITKLLTTLFTVALSAQPSLVFPTENYNFPGNDATYFAQNPGGTLGIVIDNLQPIVISSISFRPNFYYSCTTLSFPGQVLTILLKVSSGPISTFKMVQPYSIDNQSMQQPLGIFGTQISFPPTKTQFPPIGLQAFLPESFSIVIPFKTPYSHPGGNLQIYMEWPGKANSFPVALLDTQVIKDPFGMDSGVSVTGNQSLIPTIGLPFFCFSAQTPVVKSIGPLETPIETIIELFGDGALYTLMMSASLTSQQFNWSGPFNIPCSVSFDFAGAIAIPYTRYTTLPLGWNSILQKNFVSAIIGAVGPQGMFTSAPIVMTVPLIYPPRQYQGINPHIPYIRCMEYPSSNSDWTAIIMGIN